jgi:hypothetical protein
MSTNRPAPSAQIVAIAATLALIVTTFVIALASFAAGAYPHRPVEEPFPAATSQVVEESREAVEPSSAGLIDPSIGRGADSPTCKHSPKSPRCMSGGGSVVSRTRGGHALRPATDGPETLLKSEWDETGPADMPGRAPGRGGWVGEEGPSVA